MQINRNCPVLAPARLALPCLCRLSNPCLGRDDSERDKPASELLHLFEPVPQLLKNVRFAQGAPLEDAAVKARIAEAEAQLKGRGRLVIRKSGTEPLIRVMAEGDDLAMVEQLVDGICDAVRVAAAV